jgi:hypothetical protein
MDGMQIVLVALVVAAGLIAALALALDMVERRRYEESLRTPDAGLAGDASRAPDGGRVGSLR